MSSAAAAAPSKSSVLDRPLCENPVWKDVTPLKQDDGEAQGQLPVVPINYPAHYSDVMDLFRAVLSLDERSERTLYLTEAVIDCNSANYSAWHFRRLCLTATKANLQEELAWVATVALDTPKNYQLWHHRRCLLETVCLTRDAAGKAQIAREELSLTAEVLQMDAKNYHAWSHRQWALKFALQLLPSTDILPTPAAPATSSPPSASLSAEFIQKELEYIDSLLHNDVRNNSAWNQRFFVRSFLSSPASALSAQSSSASAATAASASPSSDGLSFTTGMNKDVISDEITYVGSKLVLASHNESPWNYLEGLMKQHEFDHHQQLVQLINSLPEMDELGHDAAGEPERALHTPNRFAMSLLVELFEAQSQFEKATTAADKLAENLDPVRSKYWQFRSMQLKQRIEKNA